MPAGAAQHIADGPLLDASPAQATLPPQRDPAASEYTSAQTFRWLETETQEPSSVTEETTRLLQKEKKEK